MTRAWRKKGQLKRRERVLDTLLRYEPQSKQQQKEINTLLERTNHVKYTR